MRGGTFAPPFPPPPLPPPPPGVETYLCRAVWGGGCAGRAVGREWWAWAGVAPHAAPATGPRGGGRRVGPGGVAWAARRLWACSEVRRTEGSRPRACQHDHSHRPAPSSRHRSAGTRRARVRLSPCFAGATAPHNTCDFLSTVSKNNNNANPTAYYNMSCTSATALKARPTSKANLPVCRSAAAREWARRRRRRRRCRRRGRRSRPASPRALRGLRSRSLRSASKTGMGIS